MEIASKEGTGSLLDMFMSTYYVPKPVLGTADTVEDKHSCAYL